MRKRKEQYADFIECLILFLFNLNNCILDFSQYAKVNNSQSHTTC